MGLILNLSTHEKFSSMTKEHIGTGLAVGPIIKYLFSQKLTQNETIISKDIGF